MVFCLDIFDFKITLIFELNSLLIADSFTMTFSVNSLLSISIFFDEVQNFEFLLNEQPKIKIGKINKKNILIT